MAKTKLSRNELAEVMFTSAMYEKNAKRLANESKRERFAEEKELRGARPKKVVKQPRRSLLNDEDEAILRELRFI